MRWQFGGNLQPVRMICEFDWRECPAAIINYVWSEIVTDVVECLTNEWMIWRVIAMLFVCSVLIHTIYSKTKLLNETTVNRKNLNVVGCKVQDLELKVNILTYKMQYGTWPLPRQIHGSGVGRELRNVQLTLTNSNDRNAWIKHMLLSPSENASCIPYAKIGPRSVRCLTKLINLETKYMSSKFGRDQSPISTKEKTSIMGSEKSLGYEKMSAEMLGQKEASGKVGKSENLGLRKVESSMKATSVCRSETQAAKYRETPKRVKTEGKKASKKCCQLEIETPEKRVNATQETLHQVREKLENLHSVLRIYGQPMSQKNQANSANQELAETILRELKDLGNLPESETDTKTQKSFTSENKNSDSNGEDVSKKEAIPGPESTSEFEQCHSDPDFSSSSNYENCPTRNISLENNAADENVQRLSPSDDKNVGVSEKSLKALPSPENCARKAEGLTIFPKSLEKPSPGVCQREKNLETSEVRQPPPRNVVAEEKGNLGSSRSEKPEKMVEKRESEERPMSEEQTIPSPISSTAEFSKDSDTDEKSNASLLREALKFKNALITQMELEDSSELKAPTGGSDESESDEASWSKSKLHFQPKVLDIISEEHSASSSTEKANKLRDKKTSLEGPTLRKIESSSSLKLVDSRSLKLIPEKPSESPERGEAVGEKIRGLPGAQDLQESADLTTLVNESVQNIREYIEAFSQMQKEAIVEAKLSLRDEKVSYLNDPANAALNPEEKSSADSITRFVNEVAMTPSEELPRKLSEPAIIRLVDLSMLNSEEDSPELGEVDFSLRRRPGLTSLAENCEERSIFESANSLDEFDEILTSDFSCKQSVDYSSHSGSDFAVEKPREKDFDEKSRCLDSPLTGRTVIRATGSSTSNLELSTNDNNSAKSLECEQTGNSSEGGSAEAKITSEKIPGEESRPGERTDEFLQPEVLQESSSTYFTDQASFPDVQTGHGDASEEKFQRENDDWLYDEESSGKPDAETKNDAELDKTEMASENLRESPRARNFDNFFLREAQLGKEKEAFREEGENGAGYRGRKPEVEENRTKEKNRSSESPRGPLMNEETLENRVKSNSSKDEPEVRSEKSGNRADSSETFVINSPRLESRTSEISKLLSDSKSLYVDADSREFLNASGTSLRLEKGFLASSQSARGSCSSPLRQNVHWNTPRRGSSLTSSEKPKRSNEGVEKPRGSSKSSKNLGSSTKNSNHRTAPSGLATKSHLNLNGTRDLESSNFGRRNVNSNYDLRERRSRSYATPRKSDFSPRNSANSDCTTQRLSRDRKTQNSSKTESGTEKTSKSNLLGVNSPTISSPKETHRLRRPEKSENSKKTWPVDSAESRDCRRKISPSTSSPNDAQKLRNPEKLDSPISLSSESKETPITAKSTKSASLLGKNISKSSIPVLRSRLEAVRQTGQERRSKSPSRCALTMSTSSWSQENRSLPLFPARNDPSTRKSMSIEPESCGALSKVADSEIRKNGSDKLAESRTVIYVNIVTEQEHKSATRIVDPKKFLEYLKDRELKIQSVQDQGISVEKLETEAAPSSPRILTIVSSAVEEKLGENSTNSRGWSLRVEKREIEVSAKPSVIDTSTSISDLPDTLIQSQIPRDAKFQIFQVPKELTKDEYIVLLETLNQDPNLHQLREMHNLCNKLGLGFNE